VQALTKDVKKENLERAKNAAVCQVLVNLESRAVVSEDIGRQVLTYGHRYIYAPPPPRGGGPAGGRPGGLSPLVLHTGAMVGMAGLIGVTSSKHELSAVVIQKGVAAMANPA